MIAYLAQVPPSAADTLVGALGTFAANGPYAIAAYLLMRWALNRSDEERKAFITERESWTIERKESAKLMNGVQEALSRLAGQMDQMVTFQERLLSKLEQSHPNVHQT